MPPERPILFNAEMVRRVLSDDKTQTRRVVKHQGVLDVQNEVGSWDGSCEAEDWVADQCPYGQPGDRLWVRETWAREDLGPDDYPQLVWRADMQACQFSSETNLSLPYYLPSDHKPERWKPSIFMPRWASRLTLEVTNVRVERVQDISEDDARAEGCAGWEARAMPGGIDCGVADWQTPREEFRLLWDSINAKPRPQKTDGTVSHYTSYPWGGDSGIVEHRGLPHHVVANPWVWAVSFKAVDRTARSLLAP